MTKKFLWCIDVYKKILNLDQKAFTRAALHTLFLRDQNSCNPICTVTVQPCCIFVLNRICTRFRVKFFYRKRRLFLCNPHQMGNQLWQALLMTTSTPHLLSCGLSSTSCSWVRHSSISIILYQNVLRR